jgi:HAE1 family hydrophobic/amphiphilic exporter-1
MAGALARSAVVESGAAVSYPLTAMTPPKMTALRPQAVLATLLAAFSVAVPAAAQEPPLGSASSVAGDASRGAPPESDAARSLPISLDAALTLAETNNLGLLIEDLSTEVAQFNALGSWGAFDWVLGAQGRYTDFEQEAALQFEGQTLKGDIESYMLSLSRPLETGGNLVAQFNAEKNTSTNQVQQFPSQTSDTLSFSFSQPLVRGFGVDRATSNQRESEVLYLQQVERRRQVLQKLLRDTSDAYWNLVQTLRQLEVAESSLGLGREQLERNRRLLDAGVGTEVEVIQAEAEVAKREETRLLAEVTMRTAGDALKALLFPGKSPRSWDTTLVPTTPVPMDVSVDGLPTWTLALETATSHRPELRQQELEMRLAEIRHERAISDRRVGLDLDLALSSRGFEAEFGDAAEEAFRFDFVSYTGGLALNAPIQNRTAAYAERSARARLRAARIGFEQVETQVVSEVREAVRQLHYQSLAVRASVESLRAADRQLQAEVARYENDLSTNFQVLEYQLRLVEAMNNEQTARVNFAKAQHQLQAAQGILGERP